MNPNVLVCLSHVEDGSMSKGVSTQERDGNRQRFLAKNEIELGRAVLVHLTYETDDFLRYKTVVESDCGDGMTRRPSFEADTIFTRGENIALFLPVADCVATTVYDPTKHVLGLAHLGRHNIEQVGGTKLIEYMHREFATDPGDILVWLSPAAGKKNYPLFDFNGQSLHEVVTGQLVGAGVRPTKIIRDARDTTTDETLFSHSRYLQGKHAIDGRHAVVAMMRS